MTRERRFLIVAAAVLALAPNAAPAGTPCNDCCQVPCVEAEIRYARKMQEWYRAQAAGPRQTMEAYEAAEKAQAADLARQRGAKVGSLAACAFHLPDPKDNIATKPWIGAGWSITADAQGNVTYGFALKTDLKTCKLRESQVTLLHEVTPCSGIADAAEAHERFHVTSCEPHKGQQRTVAQIATDEVAAYDVELRELNALREKVQKICEKGTCKVKGVGAARRDLEKELEDLKTVVAKRGGKGK